MQLESFSTQPLQEIAYSYLYQEYFGDPDIQPFFDSYNSLAQGYLEWFTSTPLGVYTNSSINGPLLDWIGEGVYGISRPVISTFMSKNLGAYNTVPYNTIAYNRRKQLQSGTATVASDDIYKRVLTWHLYLGDGRQMSIMWLRRRVARFIFGVSGTDIPVDYLPQISIQRAPAGYGGPYNTAPYNTVPYNMRKQSRNATARSIQITIPNTPVSSIFQSLLNEGYLALPFQVKFNVLIQYPAYYLDENFILNESTLS